MDSLIYFKKNLKGEVIINDIPTPFLIANSYFQLEESHIINSFLFFSKLRNKNLSIISIGEDVIQKKKFLPFLVKEDVNIKEREQTEISHMEIEKEKTKKLEAIALTELETKEKKIDEFINKKGNSVEEKMVIDDEEFNSAVHDYFFSLDDEEEKIEEEKE